MLSSSVESFVSNVVHKAFGKHWGRDRTLTLTYDVTTRIQNLEHINVQGVIA